MKQRSELRAVLDSSAVLALVHRERGYELVRPVFHRAALSTVNLEEVLTKLARKAVDPSSMFRELRSRGLKLVPYTEEDALSSTLLDLEVAKPGTLSLGDRACLVLGRKLKLPIYTADRLWNRLGLAVDLRLIR